MDSDGKFWITFIGIIAIACIALFITILAAGQSKRDAMVKMVEHGADPLVASCAVYPDHTSHCAMALAKQD